MGLVWSNVLATAGVICLPIAGKNWIALKLDELQVRRYFFALTLWGVPFVIGQYSQEGEWGARWMQYHLLDFTYIPWGMALVMCLFLAGEKLFSRKITKKMLLASSLVATLGFGYITELWDTAWSLHGGAPLAQAIDAGDYVALTTGGAASILLYLWFRQMPLKEVTS